MVELLKYKDDCEVEEETSILISARNFLEFPQVNNKNRRQKFDLQYLYLKLTIKCKKVKI